MFSSSLLVIFALYVSVVSTFVRQHVIKVTPKLEEQGFAGDIELGEVIDEAIVDSPAACGILCEKSPTCHSVMMVGKLCRLFPLKNSSCLVSHLILFIHFSSSTTKTGALRTPSLA